MPIYPGISGLISDVAAGAAGISEIYAGSDLVWQKTPDYGKWDWADDFNGSAVSSRWWTNASSAQVSNSVVNAPSLSSVTIWTTEDVFEGGNFDAEVTIGSANVGGEITSFMVGEPNNHFEVTLGSGQELAIWEISNGQPGRWLASTGNRTYGPGTVVGFTRRGYHDVTVWMNGSPIGNASTTVGRNKGRIGFTFRSRWGFPIPIGPGVDHVGIMDMYF